MTGKVNHKNPLGLEVGELVGVKGIADLEYHYDTPDGLWSMKARIFKKIVREMLPATSQMRVVRCVKKATGEHVSPKYEGQGRLVVDKYHWLYMCQAGINSKPSLVHPDDIVVYTEEEKLHMKVNSLVGQELKDVELTVSGRVGGRDPMAQAEGSAYISSVCFNPDGEHGITGISIVYNPRQLKGLSCD